MEGDDGPLLPQQRLRPAPQRCLRRPLRLQGAKWASDLGGRRRVAPAGQRAGGGALSGRGEEDRRGGALRGIPPVALPSVVEKEPAALDVRGGVPEGAQRGQGRGGPAV